MTKVDRCALVASLLASDPEKSDDTGKAIGAAIAAIFNRQKEEGVQPVQKEDVAEVLRRRFFTPASIADSNAFLPHVTTAVRNLAAVDDAVRKDRRRAEDRFARSYPFHPDLTDLFYVRWTQLDRFQRTRGILRTFAIALRDAEGWDTAPLVGPNVFLPAPDRTGIAEAARELTGIATREAAESRGHDWAAILEGELAKARTIQDEQAGLRSREVEQAVCAVFLSSQPIGQKAQTRDVVGLVGARDQRRGAAAGRTLRPLARRRAVAPREGPRERVRRAAAAAEDAARAGDIRHHRPGRAGRPVRRVAPPPRPLGEDLVADANRRGGAL